MKFAVATPSRRVGRSARSTAFALATGASLAWAFAAPACAPTDRAVADTAEAAIDDAGTDVTQDDARADADASSFPPHAVVVFGGSNTDAPPWLGDTWEFDGASWSEKKVPGPPARHSPAMATVGGNVLLFGGNAGGSTAQESTLLADTWEWDGARWMQRSVSGPSARAYPSMATLDGKVVLFGGLGEGFVPLGDTWIWDQATWSRQTVPGPTPRYGSAMTAVGSVIVLSGGTGPGGSVNDTWVWDATQWTKWSSDGGAPGPGSSPRAWHAMASLNDVAVLFGGYQIYTSPSFDDTWTWTPADWTNKPGPSPGGRVHTSMASMDRRVTLFGGRSGDLVSSTIFGDTWQWDGAAWTDTRTVGPSARHSHGSAAR